MNWQPNVGDEKPEGKVLVWHRKHGVYYSATWSLNSMAWQLFDGPMILDSSISHWMKVEAPK